MTRAVCLDSPGGLRQVRGNGRRVYAMQSQDRITGKDILAAGGQGKVVARAVSAPEPPTASLRPNQALLDAMARIEEIQKGMNPKTGKDTLEYLREAREGGMYGYGSSE